MGDFVEEYGAHETKGNVCIFEQLFHFSVLS